jgi:hypothetical protein
MPSRRAEPCQNERVALQHHYEKTTKRGTFPAIRKGGRAQRIELYSAAYKLALAQLPPLQMRELPDISLRVHVSIRRQLKAGDARHIAFEAVKDVLVPETR